MASVGAPDLKEFFAMQLANSKLHYGAVPQAVHWLTAIFVPCGFILGHFGDDLFPKGPVREFGLLVHMTLGQCVVGLLIIRLLWRMTNPPPPSEMTPLGPLVALAGKLSHFALYGLLLAVPLLGIIVQLERGHALPIFALWQVHSPWPVDRNLARSILWLHAKLADAFLILAGMHAAAALLHHWIWRDRTLVRMLPRRAT
jgi:cytochrome b561